MLNGADSVGGDQYGAITPELRESILYNTFRNEIEGVCCFIQNQDLWISYKRTC
jgi:hypothetical protein